VKTKNEQELVELRSKRVKKLKCWNPNLKEFNDFMLKIWIKVINEKKNTRDLARKIRVLVKQGDETKHYMGMDWCFGRFIGKPKADMALILVYRLDVMAVNLWQKDLIKEHLYYILKHELSHYLGMTHGKPGKSKSYLS